MIEYPGNARATERIVVGDNVKRATGARLLFSESKAGVQHSDRSIVENRNKDERKPPLRENRSWLVERHCRPAGPAKEQRPIRIAGGMLGKPIHCS